MVITDLPKRKRIRLDHEVYGEEGTTFHITICTDVHRALFAEPFLAKAVFQSIQKSPLAQEADLCAICVMPDHVHILVGVMKTNILNLVQRWKTFSTNLLHKIGVEGTIWQRSFYDHALRAEEDMIATAEYIISNPVRVGLVDDLLYYPYTWCQWDMR